MPLLKPSEIGLAKPGGLGPRPVGLAGFRKDEIGGGGVELFPRRAVDQHPVFHAGTALGTAMVPALLNRVPHK